MSALLVAQIKGFAAGIAHWIVVPRREPELMGVVTPGVGHTTFGDDGAEALIGQHVHPGCWRRFCARGGDDIFTTVGRESAQPIVVKQIGQRCRQRLVARHAAALGLVDPRWFQARLMQMRCPRIAQRASVNLLCQRAATVGDDRARDGLKQIAVFNRHMFGRTHKNAAWPVDDLRLNTGRNQTHDLVLQQLPVTAAILVPDHQIHHQPLQPPVRMRLDELAHQFDVFRRADLQQHDRQIAGDGIAPQARLGAAVFQQHAGIGA